MSRSKNMYAKRMEIEKSVTNCLNTFWHYDMNNKENRKDLSSKINIILTHYSVHGGDKTSPDYLYDFNFDMDPINNGYDSGTIIRLWLLYEPFGSFDDVELRFQETTTPPKNALDDAYDRAMGVI